MKHPRDRFPHPRDQRSQPAIPSIDDGEYVFVQDMNGVIFVLPDGPHMHPKVLGGDQPANYAGDLTIRNGRIVDVTNLSGAFRFDDADGLLAVADELERQGFTLESGAVRLFPYDGSRPMTLR